MARVIKINYLISTQVSFFKCNVEKNPKNPDTLKLDIHFSYILVYVSHYFICVRTNIHVYMLYTGYGPPRVITISLDQSLTVLVVKHNIQVSTKWFLVSKTWNIIITNYTSAKNTGFNLPSIHFKISFKTHNIQHDINNNSVLNYAPSPKVSFHLSLIGLKRRTRNSSPSHHYHCGKTPYKIQPQWFSPHENCKVVRKKNSNAYCQVEVQK